MKLVLKNKQEIEIAGMNNSFSFEKFKDGKGNELSYNSLVTMYVGENETFESVKKKLSDGNNSEFSLSVGKTKRDFPGWKVDVITEDLSDRGSVITIKLGAI